MSKDKQGRELEPDFDTYAIGHADRIKIDFVGGTYIVHFDLAQIKDDGFVRYTFEEFGYGKFYDTPKIEEDDRAVQVFVEDIDRRIGHDIRAVIVPEKLPGEWDQISGYEVRWTGRVD